jgi:hypothetical protein
MNAILSITQKGLDEIAKRTHKLSLKKRSILFMLVDQSRALDYVSSKSVVPAAELTLELEDLVSNGFISSKGLFFAAANSASAENSSSSIALDPEILLSKSKFITVDFCVEKLGTAFSKLVEDIRSCRSASELQDCLGMIERETSARGSKLSSEFRALVDQINATAL